MYYSHRNSLKSNFSNKCRQTCEFDMIVVYDAKNGHFVTREDSFATFLSLSLAFLIINKSKGKQPITILKLLLDFRLLRNDGNFKKKIFFPFQLIFTLFVYLNTDLFLESLF